MSSIDFKNIDIKRLQVDEEKINVLKHRSDFVSYLEFLKYFKDLKTISKHNAIIGINFTYGWMPTVLKFKSNNLDEVVLILNKAKNQEIPSEKEIEILKKCFNNSIVGVSKILHFINPEMFAIWDSRVFYYITNLNYIPESFCHSKTYLDYLKFCNKMVSLPDYDKIHKSLVKKIGYQMSKLRTIEFIMYSSGNRDDKIQK